MLFSLAFISLLITEDLLDQAAAGVYLVALGLSKWYGTPSEASATKSVTAQPCQATWRARPNVYVSWPVGRTFLITLTNVFIPAWMHAKTGIPARAHKPKAPGVGSRRIFS
jgi:hypothetical protein